MASIPPLDARPYELILFGATGYTGKYCAEHITTSLPTDLVWAVAGRSASKLQGVVDQIKALNPDRKQPAIEECALDETQLTALARKTKLIINCVGPYSLYGEPVVKACAENGTSYVDTTGEVPWVLKMIRKYHDKAKETGAAMIPQCGFESCASDMLVHETIQHLRTSSSPAGARHVTATVHRVKGSTSGGTLATIFTLFSVFSTRELLEAQKPFILSPIPRPSSTTTPLPADASLGPQATWPMGKANAAIVERSWGLHDGGALYGSAFTYSEFMSVRSRLLGAAVSVGLAGLVMLLALPPVRWLARRLVTQPGDGASREDAAKEGFEFRAVAVADDGSGRKVAGRMSWQGGIYHVTAVYMCEAAAALLRDTTPVSKMGGGILTPACLGVPLADRLRRAGVVLDAKDA